MSLVDQLIGDLLSEDQMASQPARQPFAPSPAVPKGRFGGQGEASSLPGVEVTETQAPRAPRKAADELVPQPYRVNNDSGSGPASLEAQSRVRQEKAAGQTRYKVNTDDTYNPLPGVDAVDATAKPGQIVVQKGIGGADYSILDRGGLSKNAAERKLRTFIRKLQDEDGTS
jgi:hypothetical protein